MPRQDYNQPKAETQVTNVSPEQSLRSWHSWQATFAGSSVTFVAIGTDGRLFRFKLKDFCQGEHILIHHVHLSHVIDKDKTWLLQESAFVVSLYGPMDMFPRLAEKKKINSEKRGDEGRGVAMLQYTHGAYAELQIYLGNGDLQDGDTRWKHAASYRRILFRTVLFDAFGVGTEPASL